MAGYQVFIVAGEASGEAHAARLAQALKLIQPSIYLSGVGGEKMRRAGVDVEYDFAELAVMGLVEVIKRYPRIKQVFNDVVSRLAREQPDLLVLVDYPGFNLKLARQAKKLGIPVLYYISPKIWAWRPGRIKQIKQYTDHMAVLFPFEQRLYQSAGVPVTCVGHPLVDAVKNDLSVEQARDILGIDSQRRVIGLFPGSRHSEISRLLPLMLDAAERIHNRHFELDILLPVAPGIDTVQLQDFVNQRNLPVRLIENNFYEVIKSCDAIVAASGTVTLEIALHGVPHFICYRVAPLSYHILKHLVKIPYVGLCNIVTGRNAVTELLQNEVTAVRLEQQLIGLLTHPHAKSNAEKLRQEVLTALGPSGGANNTAKLILQLVEQA